MIDLYNGDCLIEHEKIEDGSVDLILTDLPYGTMKGAELDGWKNQTTEWDIVIDPKDIHSLANRILRKNGKMILFSQYPYTVELIKNAIPNLPHSYNMIWEKDHFANSLIAKKAPVNYYEDVLIFSKLHDIEGSHPLREYFKLVMNYIGLNLRQINAKLGHRRAEHTFYINSTQYNLCTERTYKELIEIFNIDKMIDYKTYEQLRVIDKKYDSTFNLWEGNKYKSNILKHKKDYSGYHPTQKPVALLEDLIKTFSNENDLVVDLTMGGGTTGVACINTNRKFIGIELDEGYFEISQNRINEHIDTQQVSFLI